MSYKFNVGDKVSLIRRFNGAPRGTVGIIAYAQQYTNGNFYTIFLPNNESFGHICDSLSDVFTGMYPGITDRQHVFYYVDEETLELIEAVDPKKTEKIVRKMKPCSVCGTLISPMTAKKNQKGKLICENCLRVKSYSTKNNNKLYKPSSTHKTYGFEFEAIPKHKKTGYDGHVEMVTSKYGIIPTSDCSLAAGGIEYKTPTINGLRGVRHMFNDVNSMVSFRSRSCGQHINIGDSEHINSEAMNRIRNYKHKLFDNLTEYMIRHSDEVERVCGRNFCHFASTNTQYIHGSWLNLDNNNRIEFRISKFKNPDQYFELTNMWTEMVDCIIKNFLMKYSNVGSYSVYTTRNRHNAEITSKKMIKIFQKYAAGNAKCQKYKSVKA